MFEVSGESYDAQPPSALLHPVEGPVLTRSDLNALIEEIKKSGPYSGGGHEKHGLTEFRSVVTACISSCGCRRKDMNKKSANQLDAVNPADALVSPSTSVAPGH